MGVTTRTIGKLITGEYPVSATAQRAKAVMSLWHSPGQNLNELARMFIAKSVAGVENVATCMRTCQLVLQIICSAWLAAYYPNTDLFLPDCFMSGEELKEFTEHSAIARQTCES